MARIYAYMVTYMHMLAVYTHAYMHGSCLGLTSRSVKLRWDEMFVCLSTAMRLRNRSTFACRPGKMHAYMFELYMYTYMYNIINMNMFYMFALYKCGQNRLVLKVKYKKKQWCAAKPRQRCSSYIHFLTRWSFWHSCSLTWISTSNVNICQVL